MRWSLAAANGPYIVDVGLVQTANAAGRWAFHCHLLYHMEAGMFRVVLVDA